MNLRLVINGEDKRVRINPDQSQFDKDLLLLLSDMGSARVVTKRKTTYSAYERDVEYIDLVLEEEKDAVEKKSFNRESLIKLLQENRAKLKRGHGTAYWESVADVVEKFL